MKQNFMFQGNLLIVFLSQFESSHGDKLLDIYFIRGYLRGKTLYAYVCFLVMLQIKYNFLQ